LAGWLVEPAPAAPTIGVRPAIRSRKHRRSFQMPINDLVYDVGMNNGDDTAYYLALGFRVIAIEANPELVAKAKFRFLREITAGRLSVLNLGIAPREGQLPFWICETNTRWSSFDRSFASWGDSPTHQIKVPCVRFESIIRQYGVPFFCKIDIQGNDYLCLEGFHPHEVPPFISIEATDSQWLDLLHALGYSRFKCISQRSFLPIQFPPVPEQGEVERADTLLKSRKFRHRLFRKFGGRRRALERLQQRRSQHGWTFPSQSSGPFGDQTLGRWLSYDEMKQTYMEFIHRRDAGEESIFWVDQNPISFWTDFHAKYVEDRAALQQSCRW
jgi:FkbM family methyltransferase